MEIVPPHWREKEGRKLLLRKMFGVLLFFIGSWWFAVLTKNPKLHGAIILMIVGYYYIERYNQLEREFKKKLKETSQSENIR